MACFVNEENGVVGDDLIFPNVQSCFALIIRGTSSLIGGYHVTWSTTAAALETAARWIIPDLAGGVENIYAVGNLSDRKTDKVADQATVFSSALKTTLQKAFNYSGPIWYYDTGSKFIVGNKGVAVRANRSATNATLELGFVQPNGWSYGTGATAPPNMFALRQTDLEGGGRKIQVQESGVGKDKKVGSCDITGSVKAIKVHSMKSM